MEETQTVTVTEKEGRETGRKIRIGQVVSNKMDKTVVVAIRRRFRHPLYNKFMTRTKRYYAHDAQNACNVGDTVRIAETRPLSKLKRWRVAAILSKAR